MLHTTSKKHGRGCMKQVGSFLYGEVAMLPNGTYIIIS